MALTTTPTAAQTTSDHPTADWTQQHPAHSPSAEVGGTAYDQADGTAVRFGDVSFPDSGVYLHETWTWNGHNWIERHPKRHPSGRGLPALAYDPAHHDVVLFGGVTGTPDDFTPLNDTWTWDGTHWTQRHPAHSPPGRWAANLVSDPATGTVLLFGGEGENFAPLSDTWTWDGHDWTERHPITTPEPDSSLASDPATHTVVAFGGGSFFDPSAPPVDSTWTWDGTNWTLQNPLSPLPSARLGAAVAFDQAAGNVVLFGGFTALGVVNDETWTWDGTDWSKQNPADSPPARGVASMTTDPATCGVVLFGGADATGFLGDTWVYAAAEHHGEGPDQPRCNGQR